MRNIRNNGGASKYGLIVGEGILTEHVKVAIGNTAQWSDHVFNSDHKLQTLEGVEAYVTKNKHLPGIPSADEVVKEGIDLGEMDSKLLEKIEELTLYMIAQQKQIDELQRKLEAYVSKQ